MKSISIVRHWWGAKAVGSFSQIYDYNYYTWDPKKIKELKYIIAPGANVDDASDAVESTFVNAQGSKKLLRMSPGSTQNSNLDFASGDPIEQAIGPDPFKPIVFRSWLFEHVPGAFPAAVLPRC